MLMLECGFWMPHYHIARCTKKGHKKYVCNDIKNIETDVEVPLDCLFGFSRQRFEIYACVFRREVASLKGFLLLVIHFS